MINIKVTFANGDYLTTGFNGTPEQAEAYYLGNPLNIGQGEHDNTQTAVAVESVGAFGLDKWASFHLFNTDYRASVTFYPNGMFYAKDGKAAALNEFPEADRENLRKMAAECQKRVSFKMDFTLKF